MARAAVKKKRIPKRYQWIIQDFKRPIDRVKKRVFDGAHTISRQTAEVMNSMANDVLHRLAREARELSIKEGRKTITRRDLYYAVQLMLPAGVANQANEDARILLDGRDVEEDDEIQIGQHHDSEASDGMRPAGGRRADDDAVSTHSELSHAAASHTSSAPRRTNARPSVKSTPSQSSKRRRKPISNVPSHSLHEYFPSVAGSSRASVVGEDEVVPERRPQLGRKAIPIRAPEQDVVDLTMSDSDDDDGNSTSTF